MARWIKTYHDDYMSDVGIRRHVCIFTRVGSAPNSDEAPRRVGGSVLDGRGAHAAAERRATRALSRYDSTYQIVSSRERAADNV